MKSCKKLVNVYKIEGKKKDPEYSNQPNPVQLLIFADSLLGSINPKRFFKSLTNYR